MNDKHSLLKTAVSIAEAAGTLIMDIYGKGVIRAESKLDGSPLTMADETADLFIRDELEKISGIPVISEESPVAFGDRCRWREFWLVDPLDGTKDFLARNGEFTVNIALIRDKRPVLGVIHAPAITETFSAEQDKGAYLRRAGRTTKLPLKRAGDLGYVMAVSRFHNSPLTEQFAELNNIERLEAIGSALKFGRLAEGIVDLYVRYNGSKEWDIAAGHIILKEAGCDIVDLITGAEPVYNKPDIRNNFFICYSSYVDLKKLKFMEAH